KKKVMKLRSGPEYLQQLHVAHDFLTASSTIRSTFLKMLTIGSSAPTFYSATHQMLHVGRCPTVSFNLIFAVTTDSRN
uniref:Inositol hexakisphosphate and diphosphoinositol-pentakisphosphate kinase n=1 Tax=Parascaris univalens TaxID=6257 RepID=A0A915CEU2_PARUN